MGLEGRSWVYARMSPCWSWARGLLVRWENECRSSQLPLRRIVFLTSRLQTVIDEQAQGASWVDKCLADLNGAGTPLPMPLCAFSRRILEFPTHYEGLHAIADVCEMTRDGLKARFRRRGLESPCTYRRGASNAVTTILGCRWPRVQLPVRRQRPEPGLRLAPQGDVHRRSRSGRDQCGTPTVGSRGSYRLATKSRNTA
jgi:hypothetical protein